MTRQSIGEQIAPLLYAAETATDLALAQTAGLSAHLPGACAKAYLSANAGQKAFDSAAGSNSALAPPSAHMVQTHKTLPTLARALGLDTLAIGPVDNPNDTPPVEGISDTEAVNIHLTGVVNKPLPIGRGSC